MISPYLRYSTSCKKYTLYLSIKQCYDDMRKLMEEIRLVSPIQASSYLMDVNRQTLLAAKH